VSFRARLLLAFTGTVILVVAAVTLTILSTTRDAFEGLHQRRTSALIAQARREYDRRAEDVARRTERLARTEIVERLVAELARPEPDFAPFVNEARSLASALAFDFVELVAQDGAIISSAQWPARFGYRDEWVLRTAESGLSGALLKKEELPDETVLGLVAVRTVPSGERKLYIAAGERLDREFLASFSLPEDMSVLLYRSLEPRFNPAQLLSGSGGTPGAERFGPLIERLRHSPRETQTSVAAIGPYTWQAMPLAAPEGLLGALLFGSSRRDLAELESLIVRLGAGVGLAGVALGVAIGWWAAARVSRPVNQLAEAAAEVSAGNWEARVPETSAGEIGRLARTFNEMTAHLIEQRDRLVQAERVAAWRELARRLAHELKNPLFPLQITVENMRRAREQYPEQFDEVFREGVATLLAELNNLKTIIGRFSDFARMPRPERRPVQINEIAAGAARLFDAQFAQAGLKLVLDLDPKLPPAEADADLMRRALENLVANGMDAMRPGGTLTVRTAARLETAVIEVADTGSGLTREECERLFTPYYTTKQHGTGLGLAIVQSVVSDHGGAITVSSEVGRGTTFHIEIPYGKPADS
jgi:signal transduction histidine kinase